MKLKTNLFIPEEKFARRFAKELIHRLRTESSLGTKNFTIEVVSEHPHWTGGCGYANDREFKVAKKITRQLLRYYSFPFQAKFTSYVTDGIEFTSDGRFKPEFPF